MWLRCCSLAPHPGGPLARGGLAKPEGCTEAALAVANFRKMDTPNPPRPNSQRSEVDSFKADYDEIIGIVAGEHGRIVAETSDDADRFAVIADNFVSCMNLAQGLGVVLDQRNHEGSYVLFRALYESSINLMYLCDVGDRTHN